MSVVTCELKIKTWSMHQYDERKRACTKGSFPLLYLNIRYLLGWYCFQDVRS